MSRAPITAEIDPRSMRELTEALARAATKAAQGVTAGVALTAEAAVAHERSLVPIDTGALRDGIKARYSDSGHVAKVGVWDPDLYYALFVEWGTSIRPPVPFATPAAERARVEFSPNVVREVRRRVT